MRLNKQFFNQDIFQRNPWGDIKRCCLVYNRWMFTGCWANTVKKPSQVIWLSLLRLFKNRILLMKFVTDFCSGFYLKLTIKKVIFFKIHRRLLKSGWASKILNWWSYERSFTLEFDGWFNSHFATSVKPDDNWRLNESRLPLTLKFKYLENFGDQKIHEIWRLKGKSFDSYK